MAIEASKSLFKTAILIRPALARLLIGTSGVESQPVIGPSLWAATPRTHLASLNAPRTHRTGRPHPPLTSVRYVQILSSIVATWPCAAGLTLAPAMQLRRRTAHLPYRSDRSRIAADFGQTSIE